MLQNNVAFHYWVYLCVYFLFKMVANSMIQGHARFSGNFFHYPEDTKTFADPKKEVIEKQKLLDQRATNCWRNDLENIPIFLIVALGFVLLGASSQICLIYFGAYAFLRTLHTFFLLKGKQPYRGISFGFALITTIVMSGHSIYLTFSG